MLSNRLLIPLSISIILLIACSRENPSEKKELIEDLKKEEVKNINPPIEKLPDTVQSPQRKIVRIKKIFIDTTAPKAQSPTPSIKQNPVPTIVSKPKQIYPPSDRSPINSKEALEWSKAHFDSANKYFETNIEKAFYHIKAGRRYYDNPSFLYLQSFLFYKKGLWTQSLEYANQAIIKPGHWDTSFILKSHYIKIGSLDKIKSLYPSSEIDAQFYKAQAALEVYMVRQ